MHFVILLDSQYIIIKDQIFYNQFNFLNYFYFYSYSYFEMGNGCSSNDETIKPSQIKHVSLLAPPQVEEPKAGQSFVSDNQKINSSVNQRNLEQPSIIPSQKWMAILQSLQSKVQSLKQNCGRIGPQGWNFVINKFKNYYLTTQEKTQLVDNLDKLLQYNFSQTEPQNGLVLYERIQTIVTKIGDLQNRIHFKSKYSMEQLKYLVFEAKHTSRKFLDLAFDMSQQQVQDVAKQVRKLYTNDDRAFGILSLYFRISVENLLSTKTYKQVEEQYLNILKHLENIYPASSVDFDLSKQNSQILNIDSGYQPQSVYFKDRNKKNIQVLIDYILQKQQEAKATLNTFAKEVKQVCYEYGYGFKYGTKIRSKQNKQSIYRTIEKLLRKKKYNEKLKKVIKSKIQNVEDNISAHSSQQIRKKVQKQIKSVQDSIQIVLQDQVSIEFDIKDLLRGKCIFNEPKQLITTVNNYLQKMKQNNYQIIQLDNRLSKKTNDITLITKFQNAVSQLQLVLKLDKTQNQFNHKIYELKRSQFYTPITNLFVLNKKWCQQYFRNLIKTFEENLKLKSRQTYQGNITFQSMMANVQRFKKQILDKYAVNYHVDQMTKLEEKTALKRFSHQLMINFQNQQSLKAVQNLQQLKQKIITSYVFTSYPDYEKFLEFHNNISNEEIKNSSELLTIKAQVFSKLGRYNQSKETLDKINEKNDYSHTQSADILNRLGISQQKAGNFDKAIQYYLRSLRLFQLNEGAQSKNVSVLNINIGAAYKLKGNYVKALQHYNKSLQIRQNLFGKDHFQTTSPMDFISQIHRTNGNYGKSLQIASKSLQIKQKYYGTKQNLDISNNFYNIGNTYKDQGKFDKALQYFQKCLQIRQKVIGKQSYQVANTLNDISLTYADKKQFDKALENMNKCIQMVSKSVGQQHILLAAFYSNLGYVYNQMQDFENAIIQYKKCQSIQIKSSGQQGFALATTYNNIAVAYQVLNDYAQSQQYYFKTLNIQQKCLGPQHIQVALTHYNMGILYAVDNNLPPSVQHLQKAYTQRLKFLGNNNQLTTLALNQLNNVKQRLENQ